MPELNTTVVFVLKCIQAVYQVARDVRYVRLLVAFSRWLILWIPCGLCRLCQLCGLCRSCQLCGLCGSCGPWGPSFCETRWVYTPSLAWETDRNAANQYYQLPPDTNRSSDADRRYELKSYEIDGVTYYVDDENARRLRFYLGVRKSTKDPRVRTPAVFMLHIRMLWPGCYIGSHKSSGTDYYDECMSGCPFRAVKCCLVVDPEPPAPNFSMILAIVSVVSLIAQTRGITAVIILGGVVIMDIFRSIIIPLYKKFSECLEFWTKILLAKFCTCRCIPCLILLLESMNESMKNPSQYSYSYARLKDNFALLGNGSRVACCHEVVPSTGCVEVSRDLEAPPAALEAPPAYLDAPPADLEAPPAYLEAPPADLEAPPADLEAPPAYLEAPPADLEAPPADFEVPPADLDRSIEKTLICASEVKITHDKVRIRIFREREGSSPTSPRTKRIILECEPVPSIEMRGKDDYEDNDWARVEKRMQFAAKYHLFPVWSMDNKKAHCKEIKYDFFSGRYHKGCLIKFTGTRVVGGDFELDTEGSVQTDVPQGTVPVTPEFEIVSADVPKPMLSRIKRL